MEPAAPDRRDLAAAVRAAQADAERHFGDGPVPPWEPPSPLGPAARHHLAVVAGVALLALAALVAVSVAGTPAVPPLAPASAQHAAAAGIEPMRSGYDDIERATPVDSPPRAAAAASAFELHRHGAQWQFDARGVSRLEAARRLADASGSSLHGPLELLERASPLHLRWQGRSLSQAWPQVLGAELNYALQCRRDRCQAWIVGTAAVASTTTAAIGAMRHLPPSAAPVAMHEADRDADDASRD